MGGPVMYSVPMALEDYVPVICAGFAFFWIADTLTSEHAQARILGRIGALLVTAGGFSKATWKLIMALSESTRDIVLLDKALFFLLAAGFVCLAGALLAVRRGWSKPILPSLTLALSVVSVAALLYAQGLGAYRGLLLAVMVLANTTTLVLSIQAARRRGLPVAALLISAYLVTGFIMPSLSRFEQSTALQWVAQTVNSTGAIGLFFGSRLLRAAHVASARAQS